MNLPAAEQRGINFSVIPDSKSSLRSAYLIGNPVYCSELSDYENFWIPAFAGMTAQQISEFTRLRTAWYLP
jgi:hypothetical protein